MKRFLPLLLIALGLFCFFYFKLYTYLSFESLKENRETLLEWTLKRPIISALIYIGIYVLATALSIPGATILTLAGGFLFGLYLGTVYVVLSATVGACLLYLSVKTALGNTLAEKAGGFVSRMEAGFNKNAMSYLLFLRLVPLFPFWVVNIVPAVLKVPIRIFITATFLGIIPGSFVYVLVGNGLGSVFDRNETPNLKIIFEPQILSPMIALGVLALVPIFYKKFLKK